MDFNGSVPKHIDSQLWQGYRGAEKGMIVFYPTDPVSEMPIREVPEEYPSTVVPEPNYESQSYGFFGCPNTKTRAAFIKSKLRYLFFMTKYVGANYDFLDQLMVTGFYRISHTTDTQKLHVRYLDDCSCMSEDTCTALRADQAHFVSLSDAFILTPAVFAKWECPTRVTRQTRIVLSDANTTDLLVYLRSKKNVLNEYIEETKRLQPAADADEIDEENGDPDETQEMDSQVVSSDEQE
jgi:hypothetical protein